MAEYIKAEKKKVIEEEIKEVARLEAKRKKGAYRI
jgi:hypothetical protein